MVYTSERLGGVATALRPAHPRVSVVVPARNEAQQLEQLLPSMPDVHEVILVDGGSADDTIATARRLMPDIRVTRQRRAEEGQTLAAGLAEVTGDVVVVLDADAPADPREIPRLVEALVDGADVAQGTRFRVGGSHRVSVVRHLGNTVLNRLGRRVLRHDLSDLRLGLDAFWADLLPLAVPARASRQAPHQRVIWGDGFEVERAAMASRFAAADATITEVSVAETPSTGGPRGRRHGSVVALVGGLRVLTTLVSESRRARADRPAPGRQHVPATPSRVAP